MWNSRDTAGLTLIELLIALSLATLVLLFAFQGYVYGTREWGAQHSRLGVQQNLRTAVDILMREIRLGGACLPDAGLLTPFNGLNQQVGGRDADVLVIHANITCAKATLTTNQVPNSAAALHVDIVDGFSPGQQVYILHSSTTRGEFFIIDQVSSSPPRIQPADPLSEAYPQGSSVFGVGEKAFGVDSGGAAPTLTVDPSYLSGAPPVPIVKGIEALNVRFVLNRLFADAPATCVAATDGWCVVDPPAAGSADWSIIREVEISLVARSLKPVPPGDADGFLRMPAVVRIKPRNLIYP
jgi:type II secretory pathway pseudopilin PulG